MSVVPLGLSGRGALDAARLERGIGRGAKQRVHGVSAQRHTAKDGGSAAGKVTVGLALDQARSSESMA